jgi:hypothetical protein
MKKVNASLTYGLHPMKVTAEGVKFNENFIDRLYEKEEYFRERIILKINELAGNDWSVQFTEYPVLEPTFFVDITAEDKYLQPIIGIISEAFPEVGLHFWKPNPFILLWKRKAIAA